MLVVLDVNILKKAADDFSPSHITCINLFHLKSHSIVLDHEGLLKRSYLNNVGKSELFIKWHQRMLDACLICYRSGNLRNRIRNQLSRIGFHEPEDQLIVALAINSEKYIITEDSDFGKGDSVRAVGHRDVLKYLINDIGLTVHDAEEACIELNK